MSRIISCEVRGSYVSVFQPRRNQLNPDEDPKYSVQLLIPKTAEGKAFLKDLRSAYGDAIGDRWPKGAPSNVREFMGDERMKPCVRDGDKKENDAGEPVGGEYAGHWYLNASNKKRPGVVEDSTRKPPMSEEDFQSGDYCYVQLSVYGYSMLGNNGVGFGLRNVLITRKGEPLTGHDSPDAAFKAIPKGANAVSFSDSNDDDPLGGGEEDPLA